jgi:3-keto-5-aminohexanoate cleavage enzyme
MGDAVLPTFIAVAPTGARRTRADHPRLPHTIAEIAAEAGRCLDAGAAMLHLHVRDAAGGHSLDAGLYREAIAAVRERVGDALLIQVTTEAAGRYSPDEQAALIEDLRPEAVSLALRELLADGDEQRLRRLFAVMAEAGVWPQVILYDAGDAGRLAALIDKGSLRLDRPGVLFVLGRYTADQQSSPGDLQPFIAAMAERAWFWQVCAFGRREHDCIIEAIARGGHVRVGFENNLHLPGGALAESNAELVRLTAQAARAAGRPPMTAAELRALIRSAR